MCVLRNGFWILFLIGLKYAYAEHEDCEIPPKIEHGTVKLSADENDDIVTALYACKSGYKLQGNAEIYCDLDTDIWQSDPPTCHEAEATSSSEVSTDGKKKRKNKGQDVQEETNIESDFAKNLDVSCMGRGLVKAPIIENAYIVKYNRRKKDGNIFLVAFYDCEEDFELEDPDQDRLYCSKQKWVGNHPNCLSLTTDNEEDYDGEDNYNEEDDENATDNEDEAGYTDEDEGGEEGEVSGGEEDDGQESNGEDTNEIPTTPPKTTTKNITTECGPDRGGCDHVCKMIQLEYESESQIHCSCYPGFTLNESDGRTCTDIDECLSNNGDCEQHCNNKPGSHDCGCEEGLQIDTTNGKTCIDINECLLNNGHGPKCQDTCVNSWGSYKCSCDGLPGTRLTDDLHSCEDAGECSKNNGECSHKCLTTNGRVYCLCPEGFVLGDDWKTCQDINECENSEICEHKCENTHGSYKCIENVQTTTTTEEPEEVISSTVKSKECEEGLRLNANNQCEDINECEEENTGCQHCENAYGGYECTCPEGYELSEDEKTCQDLNECEVYAGGDYSGSEESGAAICSHECENLIGSYLCKCPSNFHLTYDKRTCVRDFCGDLKEESKCSQECVDDTNGFVCKCRDGYSLDTDLKTCVGTDKCASDPTLCENGKCINTAGSYKCECLNGFHNKENICHDIDECLTDDHKCSHHCQNSHGSFNCYCPDGLQLSSDGKTCIDFDECTNKEICQELTCLNTHGSYECICPDGTERDQTNNLICNTIISCDTNNGGCSHFCNNFNEKLVCECPPAMLLSDDNKNCVNYNPCSINNGNCSHTCDSNQEIICQCPNGYNLSTTDEKTCIDTDECILNNGGCSHECFNFNGSFECQCYHGYELKSDNHTCIDIDECLLNNGGCDQDCSNTDGSSHCSCYEGYSLGSDHRSCEDKNECSQNNGDCSHICINLIGGHQCSCPEGQMLVNDERTCDFVNECELNNGGCSHECQYHNGVMKCICPKGYKMEDHSKKNCVDINECDTNNGGCSNICHNFDGHYSCLCPAGFELSNNNHSCIDIDECIENNGNCSNICINLLGSNTCACETGFELDVDNHSCIDIDECTENIHDCSHHCINVAGTFECECPHGYIIGMDHFTCEDINECNTRNGGCTDKCENTLGSYLCTCSEGHFLLSDNKTCSDFDECNDSINRCSHDCLNTIGTYKCLCPTGLELTDDLVTCRDIDECSIDDRNGGCSHICENFEGSYRCRCPHGLHLTDDKASCRDVDECLENNGGCEHTCINHHLGHHCECHSGFILKSDNKTCENNDPCLQENGGCEHECHSNNGNVFCSCRDGFAVNSTHISKCDDIDECNGENNCHHTCVNTIGSYSCNCNNGFKENDLGKCIDVDECEYFNGGCSKNAKCVNLVGSFKCLCPDGHKIGEDRKTCMEIQNHCQLLKAPRYGDIRCTRSRHRTQLFYRTRCSIWCNKGYKLQGHPVRNCNGTGHWDGAESICVPQSCPRLPRPEYGTILPVTCMLGKVFSGERCTLHCASGFKPVGQRTTVCDTDQKWVSNAEMKCVPAEKSTPIKPFIKCPPDTHLFLARNKQTIQIRLEQPKTNVDWWKNVDTHPSWAKKLEAHLAAGVHVLTFRARSPNSNLNDICRTVITVKEQQPPEMVYCTESFEVQLEQHEQSRAVYWKEPVFNSQLHLKQIYKSKTPGSRLTAGVHYISYVATDIDGQSSKCNFRINVRASEYVEQKHLAESNHLENHDSYLICPGKSAVKIETNFPLQLPRGCFVKNIRIPKNRQQHHLRHHPNNNHILRHYSSWDTGLIPQGYHHGRRWT